MEHQAACFSINTSSTIIIVDVFNFYDEAVRLTVKPNKPLRVRAVPCRVIHDSLPLEGVKVPLHLFFFFFFTSPPPAKDGLWPHIQSSGKLV